MCGTPSQPRAAHYSTMSVQEPKILNKVGLSLTDNRHCALRSYTLTGRHTSITAPSSSFSNLSRKMLTFLLWAYSSK